MKTILLTATAIALCSCTQQFPIPGGGTGKATVGTFKETPIEDGGRPGIFIEREVLPVSSIRGDK